MSQSIFIFILAGIILLLLIWVIRTEIRLKKFFTGKKAGDLEGVISEIASRVQNLENTDDQFTTQIKNIDGRVKRSVQNLGVVRFNPFGESSGSQSFSVAMADENGDGVVISSLYSRERTSIFAKPLKENKSEYELTAEERNAIKKGTEK